MQPKFAAALSAA